MRKSKKCYMCGREIPEEDDLCLWCNDDLFYLYDTESIDNEEESK